MKNITLVWLLVAASAWSAEAANVKRFELNSVEALTVTVPPTIRVQFGPAAGGQPAHLIFSDTNKVCELRMVLARSPGTMTDAQIKNQLVDAGKRLLSATVEKEIKVQDLKGSIFTCFYFELTDSRPDPLQGSRYVLQGLGRSPTYVCEFVMLTNRKDSDVKEQILSSVRSINIQTKK